MNLITLSTLILPLLAPVVAASEQCTTDRGSVRVNPVPTTTATLTAPPTTQTLHARSFEKRDGGDVSVFVTHTIKKFGATATRISTFFSTLTATETTTLVVSVTQPTTIAAPTGFSPIQDTINTGGLRRRAISHPHGSPAIAKRALAPVRNAAAVFPTLVRCTTTVANLQTATVIVTQGPPTVTDTRYVTVTNGFHTATYDTLVYTTTTTTQTSTSTSTIYSPTTYAACNDQNQYGPNFQNGGQTYYFTNVLNNGPGNSDSYHTVPDGATSAMECCQSCFAFGACETYLFRASNQGCILMTHKGETCSSQSQHTNIILSTLGSDVGAGYVVGNGPCGYAYSGNSDGTVFTATE